MRLKYFAAVFALVASGFAFAGAECPKAPKEKWMHALDLQKRIVNEYGFAIKKFQTADDCYEIYGWGLNEKGDKFVQIEVYFNPVNGDIVKKEIKD